MSTTKRQLRKHIASILRSLSADSISNQSEIVVKKVLSNQRYQASERVSLYLSTPQEINTQALLQDLFNNGKTVFVPVFDSRIHRMNMVRLRDMDDFLSLSSTIWNIKQPRPDEDREDAIETGGLDLVIAPGVAFTEDGRRLGHGKGYYDSYFAHHKDVCGIYPYSIALALREQIVDDVPVTEYDHTIDEVVHADFT